MGLVYKKQGDYPRALEYYQMCLDIESGTLGKDHPSVAQTYNNMGAVYYHQADYPRALEYYQMALDIWSGTLGKDHPSIKSVQRSIDIVKGKMN